MSTQEVAAIIGVIILILFSAYQYSESNNHATDEQLKTYRLLSRRAARHFYPMLEKHLKRCHTCKDRLNFVAMSQA